MMAVPSSSSSCDSSQSCLSRTFENDIEFFRKFVCGFLIVLSVKFFYAPLFFKVINNPVFESEVKFSIAIEPQTYVSSLDYCPIRSNTERRAIANRSAAETTRESRLERSLVITSYYNYSLEMNQWAFVLASEMNF
jgi:hypothetical protein